MILYCACGVAVGVVVGVGAVVLGLLFASDTNAPC